MNDDIFLAELHQLVNGPHNFLSNLSRCKKYAQLKQWIISKTTPLLDDTFYTLGTRIFYILNGFTELPTCANPNCKNVVKTNFTVYTDRNQFFKQHCCVRCVQFDPEVKEKIQTTTLSRHNCKRGNHSSEMYEKSRKTCLEKYGVDNPLKSKEVRAKIKQTCLDKYGVQFIGAADSTKQKIKQTCLEKYGVSNPLESKDVQDKIRQTCLNKYGVDHISKSEVIQSKVKQSLFDKYGSSSYLGTQDCLNKTKKFCQENYGVDYVLQSPEIREKIVKTNLTTYGHAVAFGFGTEEHKDVLKRKYGVEHVSQVPEIRKKTQHRYVYNSIAFDSAPEIAFYIYLTENNIPFEYQPDVKFEYSFENKLHFYMPDFKVDGQFVELKGDQFFDKNSCMVNPFDHSQDLLYEAKHQCMIKNNVKILRPIDYQKYLDYINDKYGKTYLKQFKTDTVCQKVKFIYV